ncbi:MAG: response regulator transcription factor [Oscillospiraceae bacterium]|nr:response regulator transcription factor [Oscillospiraceae bacterium]
MNIIVVDDDNLVAISLKTILEASGEVTVLDIGNSGEDAVRLYEIHKPDILLMDIRMGGMTGIEAGEIILKKYSDAKILYLTTFSDDEYIVKALQLGTKGYILKQNFECIVPALRTVMEGQTVFGDDVINRLPSLMQKQSGIDYEKYDINEKEKEIIELIAEGLSNKEIAAELFLSEGTVRNYLSSILEKLELRDRTQLAVVYYNHK